VSLPKVPPYFSVYCYDSKDIGEYSNGNAQREQKLRLAYS